jgi:hypothetical protein
MHQPVHKFDFDKFIKMYQLFARMCTSQKTALLTWNLKLSHQWRCRFFASGLWRHAILWVVTDTLEEPATATFRAKGRFLWNVYHLQACMVSQSKMPQLKSSYSFIIFILFLFVVYLMMLSITLDYMALNDWVIINWKMQKAVTAAWIEEGIGIGIKGLRKTTKKKIVG